MEWADERLPSTRPVTDSLTLENAMGKFFSPVADNCRRLPATLIAAAAAGLFFLAIGPQFAAPQDEVISDEESDVGVEETVDAPATSPDASTVSSTTTSDSSSEMTS